MKGYAVPIIADEVERMGLENFMFQFESELIEYISEKNRNNWTQVAKALQVNRTTLVGMRRRLGLYVNEPHRRAERS